MTLLHDDIATGAIGGGKRIWKCYGDYLHNLLCDCYKRAKDNDMKLFSIASIGKCYGSKDVGALFRAQHTHRKTGNQCYQTNQEYKKCSILVDVAFLVFLVRLVALVTSLSVSVF